MASSSASYARQRRAIFVALACEKAVASRLLPKLLWANWKHEAGEKDMGFIPGGWEVLVIAGVVVLLFGVNKLPKLGGAIGESIKNFKKGIKDTEIKSIEGEPKDSSQPSDSPPKS